MLRRAHCTAVAVVARYTMREIANHPAGLNEANTEQRQALPTSKRMRLWDFWKNPPSSLAGAGSFMWTIARTRTAQRPTLEPSVSQ